MTGVRLPRPSECRSCADPIRFVKLQTTGKALPVNPRPDPDHGNVVAHLAGSRLVGYVISADHGPSPLFPFRFVPHYATCPAEQKPTRRRDSAPADDPLFPI
ncbi:MAG: hypothetical protein CMF72_24625 [Mameliella sp.]|nr:hypothetical protein [Mameliella sp.]